MTNATDARTEQSLSVDENVELAREYVARAASLLSQLGPRYEKLSWLIEDALVYFNLEDDQDLDLVVSAEPTAVRSVEFESEVQSDVKKDIALVKR